MVEIKQHIPSFVSGFEPKRASVDTADNLHSIDWISSYREDPQFYRFSVSRDPEVMRSWGQPRLLIAEFNEGRRWWVVGYLSGDMPELPSWVRRPSSQAV